MWRYLRWLTGKQEDMVWNALVIVTVMLPLMSLTIDVPRYFILRSTLQNATDAAAEAAAQSLDAAKFIDAGEVQLLSSTASRSAGNVFTSVASPMTAKGYDLNFDSIAIDESKNEVTVTAYGKLKYLFNLTPEVSIHAKASSKFRSIQTH